MARKKSETVKEEVVIEQAEEAAPAPAYATGDYVNFKGFPAVVSVVNDDGTYDLFVFRQYDQWVKNLSPEDIENA